MFKSKIRIEAFLRLGDRWVFARSSRRLPLGIKCGPATAVVEEVAGTWLKERVLHLSQGHRCRVSLVWRRRGMLSWSVVVGTSSSETFMVRRLSVFSAMSNPRFVERAVLDQLSIATAALESVLLLNR